MADFDKIRRNVKRMVDGQAPEAEIDSYLGSEGVTPDQLRAAPKGADRTFGGDPDLQGEYKLAKQFTSPLQRRILDSAMMGGADEAVAGLGALVETPFSKRSLSENYDRKLKVQRALRDDARSELDGAAGVAADVVGGFMMAPGRALQGASAVARTGTETMGQGLRRIGGEIAASTPQAAKIGAIWGGGNAFLGADGSPDPNAGMAENFSTRAAAVPGGAVEGAIAGPAFNALLRGGLGVRDVRRGQNADRIDRQMLNRMQWEAEGMTAPGYAISESPSVRATAPSLADSIVGGSLRNDAAARTAALEARAQGLIRQETGGAASNDLGEAVQGSLRRNLHEYDIPNRDVREMPTADLERISGPVTQEGFRPPRPNVEPVMPREVPEVTPEQFKAQGLPGRVPPAEPQFEPVPHRNIPLSPDLMMAGAEHQAKVRNFNRKYESGAAHKQSVEVATRPPQTMQELEASAVVARYNKLLEKYSSRFPEMAQAQYVPSFEMQRALRRDPAMARDFQRMQSLRERHNQLSEELRPMREEHAALLAERKALAAKIEEHVSKQFVEQNRAAHTEAMKAAEAETLRQNARAETEHRRLQAAQEAERDTQAARDAAERSYQAELAANPHGFRVGRTRHTYPTEFAAGYERVSRETPSIQRNVLGRDGEPRTATEGLLHDFAATARRQNQAAGYRNGQLFGVDGSVMHPGVARYLERNLGPDIAGQLQAYAQRRAKGGFNPGIDGVRDLRTAVRRAAQDAERGTMPGETRTTDAAMLRRLEGALSEDLHAFQREAGPQGERSSQMMRGVDTEYARVAEELRQPLARIYSEKTAPVDAMNKLATAAEKGDTRTLSAFMRVMAEKDNPTRAATAIISHMTEGAGSLDSFVRGYGKIAPESRAVLFRGSEGQALRASFDRLENLMGQLRRYQTPIAGGGGIDFTRRVNLMLGFAAISHPANAMMLAGGGALLSRFMASPRYVNWLTTLPRSIGPADPGKMQYAVARLIALAESDPDHARGKAVLDASKDMLLPSRAKAAPLSPADRAQIKPLVEPVVFAGKKGATADLSALRKADAMEAGGADKAETWKQTGWVKGADGQWRYEVDDSAAKVSKFGTEILGQAKGIATKLDGLVAPLSMILDHKELYRAYPKLANIPVEIYSEAAFPAIKNMWGYLDRKTGKIVINADKASSGSTDFLHTLLHEFQHRVQQDEGFFYGREMGGISPGYDKRPGEIEAYDTGKRRKLDADQRRLKLPAIVEDAKQLEWAGAR
jgi:hypothetical protein